MREQQHMHSCIGSNVTACRRNAEGKCSEKNHNEQQQHQQYNGRLVTRKGTCVERLSIAADEELASTAAPISVKQ